MSLPTSFGLSVRLPEMGSDEQVNRVMQGGWGPEELQAAGPHEDGPSRGGPPAWLCIPAPPRGTSSVPESAALEEGKNHKSSPGHLSDPRRPREGSLVR